MSVFLAAQEDARHEEVMVHNVHCMNEAPPSPPPPLPRTNRTSLVPPLVLSGHVTPPVLLLTRVPMAVITISSLCSLDTHRIL
jgi:hypothetical protein